MIEYLTWKKQLEKEVKMINRFLILAFVFSFSIGYAQDNLPTDTFRVVKEYKPSLINADKISFQPEIDDEPQKLDTKLSYEFINKQIPVDFEIDLINPARIKGEPLVRLYNGYAKLGVGNAFVPLAEIYYNNLRSKKYSAGTHINYTKLREVNAIKESDRSQLHTEVFGKRFWKTNTLDANLSYDLEQLNYYGFYKTFEGLNVPKPMNGLDQTYNRISSSWNLKSTKQDSFNLRHEANLDYKLITNQAKLSEHNLVAKGRLSQIHNRELYALDLSFDYNKFENIFENSILAIKPQISTIGENFKITAGLGVFMNAATEADFHFYPLAEIKFNVIEDYLVPYAGVKGQIRRNNYQSITRENPFIAEAIALSNSNEKIELYGGFRGTLSKKTSFNVNMEHRQIEAEYFYVKAYDFSNVLGYDFDLIYDDLKETAINAELAYRRDKKINVYLNGQYMFFDTEREIEAWHRPEIKINLGGEYNLRQKIITRLQIFYWGEQFAKSVRTVNAQTEVYAETLDHIIDLNLGFEYRYTKRLSAFIDFNNLSGIRYEKYQDYPTIGFNVFGGLTYSF